MTKIILASSSPRRKELFQQLGLEFSVEPSNFDESTIAFADPEKYAKALAFAKVKTVAPLHHDALIVGADTIVIYDGEVFGKPRDHNHACEILQKLNGQKHQVITGLALYDTFSHRFTLDAVTTTLHFKSLTDGEIVAYVQSGEPFGKAGGYNIAGLGSLFLENIDGDYNSVLGLPLNTLTNRLREFGVAV